MTVDEKGSAERQPPTDAQKLWDENRKLRKIAAHVPAKVYMDAKAAAGYATHVFTAGADLPREMVDFNVNDYVWVKLTETGIAELKRQHFELRRVIEERTGKPQSNEPYWMPRGDNGWHRFQLWDLMNRLGTLCSMGCDPPFETTIRIETGPQR